MRPKGGKNVQGKARAASIFLFRERKPIWCFRTNARKANAWTGRWHLSRRSIAQGNKECKKKS